MPLLLFLIPMLKEDANMNTIPPYYYLLFSFILASMVAYIILHKPKFELGALFYPLLYLYLTFFVSYLINSIRDGFHGTTGSFYLLLMLGSLVLYILLSSVLGKSESLTYLSESVGFLGGLIATEIYFYQFENGFSFGDSSFSLGWSYTPQTASTLLCLSLPFFGILVFRRKYFWAIGAAYVVSSIINLSMDSGLLVLLLGSIPLILLSLRRTGKNYPYYALATIVAIATPFAILLGTNVDFNRRVMTAVQSLNLGNEQAEWRRNLFEQAISSFRESPILGPSINLMTNNDKGQIILMSNTVLSTLVLGGSFGLVGFVIYEIRLYYLALKKDAEEKWLFFLFLIFVEVIGLIDNTLYNLAILLFLLVVNSCYPMSNRPEDVLVHDNYYQYLDKENGLAK